MKTYTGDRTIDGIDVRVDGQPLDPRLDLKRITDLGFEWTYEGDSPAQLALALLADHLGDDQKALDLHQAFMAEVVAYLDNTWSLGGGDIDAALARLDDKDRAP